MTKILIVCISIILTGGASPNSPGLAKQSASIRGRVTDGLGFPIAQAIVEISTNEKAKQFTANSDDKGNYRIDGLPIGKLTVDVRSRGFRREEFTVYPSTNEKVLLDVGLEIGVVSDEPGIDIRGEIHEPNGKPAEEVTVTFISPFNHELFFRIRTNVDGRYSFHVTFPGQYVLYAAKPGYEVAVLTIIPRGGPDNLTHSVVDIVLKPLKFP